MPLPPDSRTLLDDLLAAIDLAEAGPSEDDLTDAPRLEMWRPMMNYAETVILWGEATGHPILGNDHITTSALLAINPSAGWARTQSRWYRLGRPFAAFEAELAARLGVSQPGPTFMRFDLLGLQSLREPDRLPDLIADYIRRLRMLNERDLAARARQKSKN